MARPFHAATTLSSRPGRGRSALAASRRLRILASRPASAGSARSWSTEAPCSKVPASRDAKHARRVAAVLGAERRAELIGRPDVEGALRAVAVRIQSRGKAAFRGAELGYQPVAGPLGDAARQRAASPPPQVRVDPGQQRVVVEHLLEVRHDPVGVDAVPGEAARQLVIHAAPGHGVCGGLGHRQRAAAVRPCCPLVVPDEELQHHRRRELRRAAEAAAASVELAGQHGHGSRAGSLEPGRLSPGRLEPRSSQPRPSQPGPLSPGRLSPGREGLAGPLGQRRGDLAGLAGHLVSVLPPGLGHAEHQPLELRPRKVGTAEERLPVRRHEHGHRPAALARHRLGGGHVDAVDVRPLLPVDLDRDEVLVHDRRGLHVLE